MRKLVLVWTILFVGIVAPAFTQTVEGIITGRVDDSSGARIPGFPSRCRRAPCKVKEMW